MGTILSLLLNPKNLLIIGLSLAAGFLWFQNGNLKEDVVTCEADLKSAKDANEQYKTEMSEANTMIGILKSNLASIKKQAAEWQRMASSADELRKRIIELSKQKDCKVFSDETFITASDITYYFNTHGVVRGKVKHPDASGSDPATKEVLPEAAPPDTGGSSGKPSGAVGQLPEGV